MPLQKLSFRPGLNREGTIYSNEGGWYDGDKVRFRSGLPEKIGGWTQVSNNQYNGICRALWVWSDAGVGAGNTYIGVGTNTKYYIFFGGSYNDITPIVQTDELTNPFTVVSGSTSVTVTDSTYNPNKGDFVYFSGSSSFDGVTILGDYQVQSVPSSTTYTITSATQATGSGTGGGTVSAQYEYPSGLTVYTLGNGWSAGPWGGFFGTGNAQNTGWGVPAATGIGEQLRLWSNDNFGADLVIAPRGGPIFYWQDSNGVSTRAQYLSALANATTLIQDSTTFSSGTTSITVTSANAPYIYPYSYVTGSGIPTDAYITTINNVTGAATLNIATTGASSGTYSYSYSGAFVPKATYEVITSAVQEFVIAFGANPYSPGTPSTTFNPMLVRWSDQGNAYQWVPEITNQSGEFPLTNGSYIMGARATRQEILVWTDSALYSMQYIGAPYVWGFQILMDNISVMSPNSMITVNNVTYWMGRDRFYMYNGTVSTLPCSVKQFLFEDLNYSQSFQVFAGANEGFNEVWWYYVSDESPNNQIDKYVIYNYLDNIWYYGQLSRTAWHQTGIEPYPIAAFPATAAIVTGFISGATLTITSMTVGALAVGQLLIGTNIAINTTITALGTGTGGVGTYTINIPQTVATTQIISQNGNGVLLYHENGNDDSSTASTQPITAYIQSSDFDIGDGNNFGFVWRILPDVNFNSSTTNQPAITMQLLPRQNSGSSYGTSDNPNVQSSQNFTNVPAYTVNQFSGQIYTRLRGRQMAIKVQSTDLGVAWQLGAPRIDIRQDGRR
jgi:hypothetical protein